MSPEQMLTFSPFCLDVDNVRLWQGTQTIALRPKDFAVLLMLVQHAGRLVTKKELFDTVWPGISVSEGVLTLSIWRLRRALGDNPQAPRFIETLHGWGYRFIAPVTISQPAVSSQYSVVSSQQLGATHQQRETRLVGREVELEQLHGLLEKAMYGERQIVFVTGEPGIGKTTLVEAFLEQAAGDSRLRIGRGQCIEHYSVSEAYLPVLEALGRLCRAPDGERLITLLSQHAPTWMMQMPALLSGTELESVQRKSMGATPERMLREMAQALEELTAVQPLVLWLEDLHGSDYATLDLLAFLARRREPARLLVLGTYRPLAVRTGEHPLAAIQRELQVRGQCQELALEPLGEKAVAEYLAARLSGSQLPIGLAQAIHQRTEGNPLFMVGIVETMLGQEVRSDKVEAETLQGTVAEIKGTVPTNIRQFIEQQVERLRPEEQQLLEAISVAGREASAAAIAAGLGKKVEEVERRCENLARRGQFVRSVETEEWPDGTVAARYRFVHALHQEVLYDRVTAAQRMNLHRQIGTRVERGYGNRANEVAVELAMHFERGRDYERAVRYLHSAGETAMQRYAHREAVAFLTKGVTLLQVLPETPERRQHELVLHIALGPALITTRGYADSEVEKIYTRARILCQQIGETPQLFSALRGLWSFSLVRAEYQAAHELGQQLLRLAERTHDPALLLEAHQASGITLCFLGEFAVAQQHLEKGIALYDSQRHHALAFLYAYDPGVGCLVIAAWVLWFRGYPHQALARAYEALTLARKLSHPFSLGLALFCCSFVSRLCHRQGQVAQQWTEEAVALSTVQEFPFWLAGSLILQGSALAHRGQSEASIEQMTQGLTAFAATGSAVMRPYFLTLLAETYGATEQVEQALAVLEEALAVIAKTGERMWEAELYRLKGELVLQSKTCSERNRKIQGPKSKVAASRPLTPHSEMEAEACFLKAIAITREQKARSLELRAVVSLSRLWQRQGKGQEAKKLLAKIYGWFTEGFDTADLREARALIDEPA